MKQKNIKDDKRKTKWIPGWLHLPFFAVIGFLIILIFFGDNSYMKIIGYNEVIDHLNKEIQENRDSADYYIKQTHSLETDPETLERIAREQYGMKREKEDVYITEIP